MQERFVVHYIVDWGDLPRERIFSDLTVAEEFAKSITTDGTIAYPNVATIIRRCRDGDYGAWQDDQRFPVLHVSRGRRAEWPSMNAAVFSGRGMSDTSAPFSTT
ncbi:hypothetical protein E2C06_32265 [Dankookia rubra]|uniref:Uncharacterized protein n=1 Tax=Dankookia rubra TaxID=1442381 RepID=A0A4R5Q7F2_9PROT|nr:hypothetical protein [Dankookia rubra]TDH58493.1 hypothetical protein E2C06_32265 [Dankookia rubra]